MSKSRLDPEKDSAERLLAPLRPLLASLLERHYRALHEIPELAFEEHRTSAYLRAALAELDLSSVQEVAGTGLAVELPRGGEGPTVMLRADMDGLPITEEAGHLPLSSIEGQMHACGHDGHMAIALAAAAAVAKSSPDYRLPGRLIVLFQPAEESGGGARRIVESGLLDSLGVDYVLGLHLWSFAPLGEAIIPDGAVMASSDEFRVIFKGPGGHGALPHESHDTILAAAHLVVALQGVVSRNIDPAEPAVVTVGRLRAGDAPNVIPRTAEAYGTFRAASAAVRGQLMHRIGEVSEAIGRACGLAAEVDFGTGYPPTVNDPTVAERYRAAAAAVLGDARVRPGPPAMASEDFAFYLQARPGAFCLLGMGDEASDSSHPHHSPAFRIAPAVLPTAVEILLRAALRLLEDPPGR